MACSRSRTATASTRGETQKRRLLLTMQSKEIIEDVAALDTKVVVIGGSGRVGGSTVRALRQLLGPNVELVVGGRSERNFVKSVEVRDAANCAAVPVHNNVRYFRLVSCRTTERIGRSFLSAGTKQLLQPYSLAVPASALRSLLLTSIVELSLRAVYEGFACGA